MKSAIKLLFKQFFVMWIFGFAFLLIIDKADKLFDMVNTNDYRNVILVILTVIFPVLITYLIVEFAKIIQKSAQQGDAPERFAPGDR